MSNNSNSRSHNKYNNKYDDDDDNVSGVASDVIFPLVLAGGVVTGLLLYKWHKGRIVAQAEYSRQTSRHNQILRDQFNSNPFFHDFSKSPSNHHMSHAFINSSATHEGFNNPDQRIHNDSETNNTFYEQQSSSRDSNNKKESSSNSHSSNSSSSTHNSHRHHSDSSTSRHPSSDANTRARNAYDEWVRENIINPGNKTWQDRAAERARKTQDSFLDKKQRAINNSYVVWGDRINQNKADAAEEARQRAHDTNTNTQFRHRPQYQYTFNNGQRDRTGNNSDTPSHTSVFSPKSQQARLLLGLANSNEVGSFTKPITAEEIKLAFKSKALETHPDRPSGNEKKFKEVQAAYDLLINMHKSQTQIRN